MKLAKIGTALSKLTGRTGLILQKYSPEILLVVGITGAVGSAILACRATLHAEAVLEDHEYKIEQINRASTQEFQISGQYTEENRRKDLVVTYVQTSVDFIKLYGPSVTLGVASICCIIGAHGIMRKRSVALMAAYKALEEGYNAYRKRVIEEYGEAKDYQFKHGLTAEQVTEVVVGEDGKKKKVVRTELVDEGLSGLSPYARRYNRQTSDRWATTPLDTDDHSTNIMFLQCQQNYLNNLLQSRGHVFLNEVYDHLGLKRSGKAGQMVGWLKGNGDDFIDFGLDFAEQFMKQRADEFILDFNVDGVIYDLI